MLNILNFFKGYVVLEVESPYPERFLNICSRNDVSFWRLKRLGPDRMRVRIYGYDLKKVKLLAEKSLASVRVCSSVGAPFFLMRFRKRYLFIAGFLLSALLLFGVSRHVWEIEVLGCETISEERILKALRERGFQIGFKTSELDADALQNSLILEIPELSWIAVNIMGSRAQVEVRERTPQPEIVDIHSPANVVAIKAGVISELTVREGSPQAAVGETVKEGQLLVSGIVDSGIVGARFVHAMADVTAMTWYTFQSEMPLQVGAKSYTGEEMVRRALRIVNSRINLYKNSGEPYANCDKIVETTPITLPGGLRLPLTILTETYREYTETPGTLSSEDAAEVLKQGLMRELLSEAAEGEIVSSAFDVSETKGFVRVTLIAECREQIAKTIILPKEDASPG